MAEVVIKDLREGYIELVETVLSQGELVSPRGMKTKELRNVTIRLEDPVKAIPMGVGRKLNMKIGAVETTQLIAGVSSAMQINLVSNNNFEAYMNNGRLLGAYGPRLYPQLETVIKSLCEDPDTRQAAALVWRNDELLLAHLGNRDVPCTVALQWCIRDGKLCASTVMRSNDVWLGVAYDFWMFTRLQLTLAWALGIPAGDYIHHAFSFHMYERDWKKVDQLATTMDEPTYPMGYTERFDAGDLLDYKTALGRWRQARGWAEDVVWGNDLSNAPENVQWYAKTLKDHKAVGTLCGACRYVYTNDEANAERIADTGACLKCAPTS